MEAGAPSANTYPRFPRSTVAFTAPVAPLTRALPRNAPAVRMETKADLEVLAEKCNRALASPHLALRSTGLPRVPPTPSQPC